MQCIISKGSLTGITSCFSTRNIKNAIVLLVYILGLHTGLLSAAPVTLSYTASDYNGYNISCHNASDGSIDLTVNTGIAPFSYVWNTGDTIEDISNLSAGIYIVLVTDSVGDTASISITLTEPLALQILFTIEDDTCSKSVGSVVSLVSGGNGSQYNYNWSTGATSSSIQLLIAGNYTLTVSDSNSCSISSDTLLANISGPTLSALITNVSCFSGMDGGISLSVNNGTSPYVFTWSNGSTDQNISNVLAGVYTVTVTDANSCTVNLQDTITEPGVLNLTMSSSNSTCSLSNGSGSILVSGGTLSYIYNWNNGSTLNNTGNVASGTYTVTVTDGNSCTSSASITVNDTPGPVLVIDSFADVSCNGGSNGFVNIGVSSGTTPYSFLWSNGSTNQNISGLVSGTYTVTVSDANACTATVSKIISQPSVITVSLSPVDATCGASNGSISSSASGGNSPYLYSWNTGSTNSSIASLASGVYTLTVTDINSCTQTKSAIINSIGSPTVSVFSFTNISCNGGADGSIDISVTGGTSPFSFVWSNGSTLQNLNGLSAGTYTVTVSDANVCTATLSITLTQPSVLTVNLNGVSTSCGLNNGSITSNISGGTSGYSFIWNNGASTQNISGLSSGVYTVTVTDMNLCTKSASVTIGTIISPTVAVSGFGNVSCNGGNNGFVNINVSNGTAPFTYSWSNGSTTKNISSLVSSTYTVTISDANLCTATLSQSITQPSVLTVNTNGTNATCGSANGTASALASGGTVGYLYSWSNGSTNANINSLSTGVYTVTVTDANSCTITGTVTIANAAGPVVSVSGFSNVSCNGGNNGSINITVSSGTSPFTFVWSNGATNQNLSGLTSGTYIVTVSDANSCTATTSRVITQPASLIVSLTSLNPSCGNNNGSISSSVSGGTSPYSFLWNNGNTNSSISSLSPAAYSVTVTDNNGCTSTVSSTLINQSGPSVSVANIQNVSCFSGSNGAILINVSNGTAPFSFIWSNGSTTQNISGLVTGTYTVTVSDINACTSTVSATISQPSLISVTISKVNATCNLNNGSASSSVSGGTGSYLYLWNTGSSASSISSLSSGVYTVTVTDVNSCTRTASITIVSISPPALSLVATTPVLCFGGNNGAVDISVSNGTSPFTYVWSNGSTTQDLNNVSAGTYTVTVTDANMCTSSLSTTIIEPSQIIISTNSNPATCGSSNGTATASASGGTSPYAYVWNTGATTNSISSLAAGVYTVTVTDGNACTRVKTVNLVNIGGPVINISNVIHVNCNGGNNGAINISVSGGTSPYQFLWSNGSTIQNINSLTAGTYTVTVTDQNTCQASIDTLITQPNGLTINMNKVNATCGSNNGVITAVVSGGTPSYSYLWSNGSTLMSITGLASGTYTVTVTDNNACTKTATATIVNTGNPSIFIAGLNNVTCFNGNNGSIAITVLGGTSPYSFIWNNGSTTQNINNLTAGNYTITVTDANSCLATSTFSVSEPTAVVVNTTKTNEKCNQANGTATALPSGGAGSYTYNWSNGLTTQLVNNLSAGVYTVTVSDLNSCTGTSSVTILNQSGPSISLNQLNDITCFGLSNGSIDISISGGQLPYSYLWSNGQTSQDISGLASGTYVITVSDVNACTSTASYTISTPLALSLTLNSTGSNCGVSNGTANAVVSGGTLPYSYVWSNGATSSLASGLSAGIYTVTVSDNNSCSTTSTINVALIGGPILTTDSIHQVTCNAGSDGAIFISVSGGAAPYSYVWSNGSTVQDVTNLNAGNYTVTISDVFACTLVQSFSISQPNALSISASVSQPSCNTSNGSIAINVTGGSQPYAFLWNTGQTSSGLSSVNSGIYTITVTDINSCTLDTFFTLTNSGLPSIVTDSIISVSCNGSSNGAIYISVNGGVSAYSYLWSNGFSTQDVSNITSGNYTVTVTDQTGCTSNKTFTVTQPSSLTLNTSATPASCNLSNGTASVVVGGGTSPYIYQWSNGETISSISALSPSIYTVTVTDANSCSSTATVQVTNPSGPNVSITSTSNVSCFGANNGSINISVSGGATPYQYAWSNSSTTQDISNLTAAVYTVTVTDASNCSATLSVTITAPSVLVVNTNVTPSTCNLNNGSATAIASGGTSAYSYSWSTGQTTAGISNLSAGVYTVTVTDANLCTRTAIATIISLNPPVINFNSLQNVLCHSGSSGSINIGVSGNGPFSYVWSNGLSTQDISGVVAGTYTVTVTDINSCTSIFDTIITQPQILNIGLNVTQPSCGQANGTINSLVSGGTMPYNYLWNTGASSSGIVNVLQGVYTLTITDQNNCVEDTVYNLIGVGSPTTQMDSIIDNPCFGGSNGAIFISINGGTSPYSYVWSNAQTTQDITSLSAGIYTVTITDQASCTITSSYTVGESSQISASFTSTPASCNSANGSLCVNPTGGNGPYSFVWNIGSTLNCLNATAAGMYTVTITDAIGCTLQETSSISNLAAPVIAVADSGLVSCFGKNDGYININVNSGTLPFTFNWSNGASIQNINSLAAGIYTLTITDSAGCISTQSIVITQPDSITVIDSIPQLNGIYQISCNGESDGSISLFPSGGTPMFLYNWSTGATTQNLNAIVAGTYTVSITDNNGCTYSKNFVLNEPPPVVAEAGFDQVACVYDTIWISALNPSYGTGNWSVFSGTATIFNVNQYNTYFVPVDTGLVQLLWTVSDGICTDTSLLKVLLLEGVEAKGGPDQITCLDSVLMNATAVSAGNGYWFSYDTLVTIQNSSMPGTMVYNLQPGLNELFWIVQYGTCVDSAKVLVTLNTPGSCETSIVAASAFTPNADGFNDFFVIQGIEDYIENKLVVFNRWGNIVYEAQPYNNKWKGISTSGNILPEGTYFYILTIPSINVLQKGFIELRR